MNIIGPLEVVNKHIKLSLQQISDRRVETSHTTNFKGVSQIFFRIVKTEQIDWIEFYVVSAIFQPYNGGDYFS